MAKTIYDYRDAMGFLPEKRFDEWRRKNNLNRELISAPRYDGLYVTKVTDHEVTNEHTLTTRTFHSQTYLRFYPDGIVLYEHAFETSLPTPKQMAVVFKKENRDVRNRGMFQVRGGQIAFEVAILQARPGLLWTPKKKQPFLAVYYALDGTLYIATDGGGVQKFEFIFVEEYQQGFQAQAPAPSALPRTPPPVAPAPIALPPSAQQAVSQMKEEGQRYLRTSSYDLALPIYQQIIRIDPTDAEALFYEGICLSSLGSHDLALAAYDRACLLKPLNALYHTSRGGELFKLQRLQEALQAYQQALQIEPQPGLFANMQAWEGIGKALEELGRTREAQEAQQHYQQSYQLYISGGKPQAQAASSSSQAHAPLIASKIGATFVTYHQPGSKVDGLAWSPDGRRIVSYGLGEAPVWEPLSGRVLYDFKVKGFTTIITAIAWSPDSTRIATAGSDKVVQVWDASTGQVITVYKGGHTKFIRCVSWSPRGVYIASCDDNDLHIWGAMSGQQAHILPVHAKALVGVRALAWSPDATRIASGGGDNHVTVWDPENGSAVFTYTQQQNTISGLAWSPDSKRLASASDDKTIHIWAAEDGAQPVICKGHTKGVRAVVFSPEGRRIASASDDGTVRIWDSETGQPLFTYKEHQKSVTSLAWSPDGRYIASGGADKTVQVWVCG